MLSSTLIQFLALTTAALAETSSPLFLLASTAQIPFYNQDTAAYPNPPATHVSHLLYRSLSTCPTTHYAVIVEPQFLNHTSTVAASSYKYLPGARNAATTYMATNLQGSMNVNHILNTILMDCLHHGILHVHELDTKPSSPMQLPPLSPHTVRENIIYARFQDVDGTMMMMGREEYLRVVKERRNWVEGVLEKYFDDEDYTLIYVRERMVVVDDHDRVEEMVDAVVGDDAAVEVPMLEIEELRI